LVGGWKVNNEGFHSTAENGNKFSLYTSKLNTPFTLFDTLEEPTITYERDDWAIIIGN